MKDKAFLRAKAIEGKQEAGAKFSDYFDHVERWAQVPSHRALAMLRGRNEDVLSLEIEVDADDASPIKPVERMIADAYRIGPAAPGDLWLMEVARWAWRVKLSQSLSVDLMTELREKSEEEAIRVFARNLKDLLLAAPAGSRATMGLDPGIRTGVKVAVVDATGKALETATIYPFPPRNDVRGARAELARLIGRHRVELIAIGNGTGSRETERLVADMLSDMPAPRAVEGHRERGRRVDLFGLRARRGRISRPRRLLAGRRLHRPAASGPVGRTGQDRTEIDRRRAIST